MNVIQFRRQAVATEQRDTSESVGTFKNQDKPVHTPHTGTLELTTYSRCFRKLKWKADQTVDRGTLACKTSLDRS